MDTMEPRAEEFFTVDLEVRRRGPVGRVLAVLIAVLRDQLTTLSLAEFRERWPA